MRFFSRLGRWLGRHRLEFGVALLSFCLLVAALSPRIFVTVPPGSVGVLWLRLFGGTVFNFHYGEGLKLVLPWDRVFVYDTRLRRFDTTVTALSSDGLQIQTAVTLSYRVNPERAPLLQNTVGPEYEVRLIEPALTSEVTSLIVANHAEELYILTHDRIESQVAVGVHQRLRAMRLGGTDGEDLINVVSFTMRKVVLPPTIQDSIDSKLSEQQLVQRYEFILQRERLESQRKAIEAEGVRQFQAIVSSNISESYLRWRGIDATLRLAESQNSKVVVIGNGPGAMPLILGGLGDTKAGIGAGELPKPTPPSDPGERLPSPGATTPDGPPLPSVTAPSPPPSNTPQR